MDQHAIFECSGLHFIGIADNVPWKGRICGHCFEFKARWEGGTASPQQIGIINHLDGISFTMLFEGLFQGHIATVLLVLCECVDAVRLAVFQEYLRIRFHKIS